MHIASQQTERTINPPQAVKKFLVFV